MLMVSLASRITPVPNSPEYSSIFPTRIAFPLEILKSRVSCSGRDRENCQTM